MHQRSPLLALCLISILAFLPALPGSGAGPDPQAPDANAYLAGYASAVVEREFGLEVIEAEVADGLATLRVRSLDGVAPQRVAEALVHVVGIERARILAGDDSEKVAAEVQSEPGVEESIELFPGQELFSPLLADPRQPHFSASLLWYLDDPELTRVGRANLGESFALLGGELGEAGTRWELGILGGVFSIFDLDSSSSDLVNSDFWVAPTFSLRHGSVSGQLRVYHQSSHLGDEFLLRNRTERVNLSYEGVDLLVSAELHPAVRIYAGGGVIVRDEPDLEPLSAQLGVELTSPVAFLGGRVRPLAAADFQLDEENDWNDETSIVAGFQLESPRFSQLRLQLLAEYFRGNSPNGQFFERSIEFVGFGAHLHF